MALKELIKLITHQLSSSYELRMTIHLVIEWDVFRIAWGMVKSELGTPLSSPERNLSLHLPLPLSEVRQGRLESYQLLLANKIPQRYCQSPFCLTFIAWLRLSVFNHLSVAQVLGTQQSCGIAHSLSSLYPFYFYRISWCLQSISFHDVEFQSDPNKALIEL